MDGTGVQNQSYTPPNKGQVVQGTINGKTVDVTVWSTHIGRSATAVVAPANTFFFANSGDLPRMSMEIFAMLPLGAPGAPTGAACFNAAHAGLPYAGGTTYLFCDGHVKWEKYVGTPIGSKAASIPGDGDLPGRAQISQNPCRYNADHDPSENFGGCQNGWN